MKVGIVGLGKVGMEYAFALLNSNLPVEEMILIDINEDALEGHVLDLKHSIMSLERNTKVVMGHYEDLSDVGIVCITAGAPQNEIKTSRDDDLYKCDAIFKNIIPNIANSGFNGIYLLASNPLDVMCSVALKFAKCNPKKIIGSGTLLDTNRLLNVVAEKYNKDLSEVHGMVLGEHGATSFTDWDSLNVEVPEKDREEIDNEVRGLGFTVLKHQGYTAYGIASALLRITKNIIEDRKEILPVSTYIEQYGIFISTPSKVGKDGVVENSIMNLSEKEQEEFMTSVNKIKSKVEVVNSIK